MKNLGRKNKQRKSSQEETERNEPNQNIQESPYYDDNPNQDFKNFKPRILKIQQQQIQTSSKQFNTQIQPSMLQYKIQKLLVESQKREQAYQQYIKKKHQQSYDMTENYLKALKKYKEQLDSFINQKNKKSQNKFSTYQANKVLSNTNKPINKYKKVKLNPFYKQERQGHKMDLNCKITVKFICPIVQDYLKDKFPQNLDIQFQLPIKKRFLHMSDKRKETLQASIKMQDDESDNMDNLINGYPFQLIASGNRNGRQFGASQGEILSYEFRILNQVGNIQNLQKGKIMIKVYDRESRMLWAYSSLSSQGLLYFSEQSTINNPVETMQNEILQFYSPYSHQKNCILHLRIQTIPIYSQRLGNRIESSGPMQLGAISVDRNLYQDQQSRQLQRINKFKSTATSLTMQPNIELYNKGVDKQKLFQKTNDKNLINYRKLKQLQTINKYKQQQKNQYVEGLFDQALTKFLLEQVEMGVPKYLVFYYEKQRFQPQKIFLKFQVKFSSSKHINGEDVLKQVETKLMMNKQQLEFLMDKGVLKIRGDASIGIQVAESEGFYVFDNKTAFVLKMIIYPNSKLGQLIQDSFRQEYNSNKNQAVNKEKQNKLRLQVFMRMYSQVGELMSQQVYKVQLIRAQCIYEMDFHNYELAEQDISIPLSLSSQFQSQQDIINSNSIRVIGSENLVYKISKQKDKLQLKLKYHKLSNNKMANIQIDKQNHDKSNKRSITITLLDSQSNICLATYRINLYSYHEMKSIEEYEIGSISKYNFMFNMDEEVLHSNNGMLKTTRNNQSIRVGLFTSHPNQSVISCNGKQHLVINSNQSYQIQLNYQSFQSTTQDRVLVHLIDLDANYIIKRWLLIIKKKPVQFRSFNQIKVIFNKQVKYPYLIKNKTNKQVSYSFFTSNYSLLTVPESSIQLSPNQQISVNFIVIVKRQNLSIQQREKGISVIVRVQDSVSKDGWNQMFKIILE